MEDKERNILILLTLAGAAGYFIYKSKKANAGELPDKQEEAAAETPETPAATESPATSDLKTAQLSLQVGQVASEPAATPATSTPNYSEPPPEPRSTPVATPRLVADTSSKAVYDLQNRLAWAYKELAKTKGFSMARSGLVRCKMGKDGKPDGQYGDNTERALKSLINLMKKIGVSKIDATPGALFLNHLRRTEAALQGHYDYDKYSTLIDKAAAIINSYNGAMSEQDKKLFISASKAMPPASKEAEAQAAADIAAVKSPPRQLPGNWEAVSVPESLLTSFAAATRKLCQEVNLSSVNIRPVTGARFDTVEPTRQQCMKFYALLNCAGEEYYAAPPQDREDCRLIPLLMNAVGGVKSRKPTPADLKKFMIKFTEIMSQPNRVTGDDESFIIAGFKKYKAISPGWTSNIPGVPEQMRLAGFDTGTGTTEVTVHQRRHFETYRTF